MKTFVVAALIATAGLAAASPACYDLPAVDKELYLHLEEAINACKEADLCKCPAALEVANILNDYEVLPECRVTDLATNKEHELYEYLNMRFANCLRHPVQTPAPTKQTPAPTGNQTPAPTNKQTPAPTTAKPTPKAC